jgi:hypothetical protein
MKKKILFREMLFEIYTDGSAKLDGLEDFFNRRQRAEIMRTLRRLAARIISMHLKQKNQL